MATEPTNLTGTSPRAEKRRRRPAPGAAAPCANAYAAEPDALAIDSFLPYLFNQLTNRMNHAMRQNLRIHRVTIPQWRVLCLTLVRGPQSVGAIETATVIAQSTVSRVIDKLEGRGLVERRPRPSNQRVIDVHLTAAGRDLTRVILPSATAVSERLVAALPESERRQLTATLRRLLDHIRRNPLL